MPEDYKEYFKEEIATAQNGLKALELVVSGDVGKLDGYIKVFGLAKRHDGLAEVGSMPPCRNYKQLVTLHSIEEKIPKFDVVILRLS